MLAYIWALPTTAVGLPFVVLAPLTGGGVQVVDGVIEVYGGVARWFLKTVGFGAAAMTLGHVVLAQDRVTHDWTRSHERVHVRQVERWGPLFLPAYGLASLVAWMRGKRAYWDNAFEREAYDKEEPL
jgi:hypothetical protein